MPTPPRDYKKIYAANPNTQAMLDKQNAYHKARRAYAKAHPGVDITGKDVNHIQSLDKGGNPLDPRNLNLESETKNRGWRRGGKGAPRYGK